MTLADDLTGAIDVATQLPAGWGNAIYLADPPTAVTVKQSLSEGIAPILTTESRIMDRRLAGQTYRRLAQLYRDCPIFHKTDSTLRGNIGAEIEAILDTLGLRAVAFIPAYPAAGRTTIHGMHHVHGVPLHRSAFADDPLHPVRDGSVAANLAGQTARPVGLLPLGDLRRGVDHAAGALDGLLARGDRIIVFDAERDDDLARIADVLRSRSMHNVVSGTAGVARYLFGEPKVESTTPTLRESSRSHRVVGFVGSVHPTTTQQVRALLAARNIQALNVLTENDQPPARDDADGGVIYHTGLGAARSGVATSAASETLLERLCEAATSQSPARRFLLAGGRSSYVVCRALGIERLSVIHVFEPGVAACVTDGAPRRYIVIKVGGFGSPRVIEQAWRWLSAVEEANS